MTIPTSISGFPRIGRDRELKKAIEAYWKGNATLDDVRETGRELRVRHCTTRCSKPRYCSM